MKKSIKVIIVTLTILSCLAIAYLCPFFILCRKSNKDYMKACKDSSLPIVEISTQDKKSPFDKETYINCSFKISNCEDESENLTVEMAENYGDKNCVGIRLRGNSTLRYSKKAYRVRFDKKKSVFGLEANKNWVLLADYRDYSKMMNYSAFTFADVFDNLGFSPTPHQVSLFLNGEFKGIYLFCEQIDEKSGRTNVEEDFDVETDKDFPFLVEIDTKALNEGTVGNEIFKIEDLSYAEIKYPEQEDREGAIGNDKVFDYIEEYVNAVWKLLKNGGSLSVSFRDEPVSLDDLVDIDSLVDYYLLNELLCNYDNGANSIYVNKTKDGKMKFGPIWDFDFSVFDNFGNSYWYKAFTKKPSKLTKDIHIAKNSKIYSAAFKTGEEFYNKVASRLTELKPALKETIKTLKNHVKEIEKIAKLDAYKYKNLAGGVLFSKHSKFVIKYWDERIDNLEKYYSKDYSEFVDLL